LGAAVALAAAPGLANLAWTASYARHDNQLISRGMLEVKLAAHSLAGWFTSYGTVASMFAPGWSVPLVHWLPRPHLQSSVAVPWWLRDRARLHGSVGDRRCCSPRC
jgi:hypothetical protein